MFPVKEFEKRFREILTRMDEIKEEADDDAFEALEEMNAEFEDALFIIECIDTDDEEWQEEFEDALAEFADLCDEYSDWIEDCPQLDAEVQRLQMVIQLAKQNLKN